MYKIISIVILLLVSCENYKVMSKTSDSKITQRNLNFEIMKIDSLNSTYLVYAKANDSLFKFVVIKDSTYTSCDSVIEVGSFCSFNFVSWFDHSESLIKGHVNGLRVNGDFIKYKDESIVQDLFFTENLNGLCLVR